MDVFNIHPFFGGIANLPNKNHKLRPSRFNFWIFSCGILLGRGKALFTICVQQTLRNIHLYPYFLSLLYENKNKIPYV
jgi:hypothetical protein